MNRILEAADFPGGDTHAVDTAVRPRSGGRLAWERYIRCLLLCAVIAAVGYLAWRPALLRLSQLMFMVSPSHGDSLAWKPEIEDAPVRLQPRRETPAPAEWRMTSGMHGSWQVERSGIDNRPPWRGSGFLPSRWQRLSGNPWNWRDDSDIKAKRGEAGQPAQKPATAFRAQSADTWGSERPAEARPVEDGAEPPEAAGEMASTDKTPDTLVETPTASRVVPPTEAAIRTREPGNEEAAPAPPASRAREIEEPPSLAIPSLSSATGSARLSELPPLALDAVFAETRDGGAPSLPVLPPVEERRSESPRVINLEPLNLDNLVAPSAAPALRPANTTPTAPAAAPATIEIPDILPPDGAGSLQPPSTLRPDTPAEQSTSSGTPPGEAVAANPLQAAVHGEVIVSSPIVDQPASVDWKNREITAPIPGAYLTIYPKLKFIGLCVPGQGYIRKYNQIAVPRETAGGKMSAADGRTPYGRYYIAGRGRGEQGPRLELSWPSPEDARRIGLDPAQTAAVENAWLGQSLPPQNTAAGGGLALTGLRGWLEATDGGFALEAPHMEEVYTALPDGAWVFIQE